MIQLLAVLTGKIIEIVTRKLNIGGGSAAPGLYALKVDPDIVSKLGQKIPLNIVITGTNGKTTTSRLIAHFAKSAKYRVIRNQTGSNLERGIASALISGYGKKYDLGIWELDEAAFNIVTPKLHPQVIVFLNAYRDQLDRYGEVDSVVNKWLETIKKIDKNTVLVINGDDVNTNKLSKAFKGQIIHFGLESNKLFGEGKSKEVKKLDVVAKNLNQNGLDSIMFDFKTASTTLPVKLNFPGFYNVYNALAAIIAVKSINIDYAKAIKDLTGFTPAFGRFEKVKINSKESYIFLIKNPTGATEVFKTISPHMRKNDTLLLALNDNFADGTDVSWIWDAEFERLKVQNMKVICSGQRAYDLAVRLKYAGFDAEKIVVEDSLKKALKKATISQKGRLFILPTYTAMLDLQRILTNLGVKRNYWEEV